MIVGANRTVTHAGRVLHVQAEDLGPEPACLEVRVYEQGALLWRKRVSYAELAARALPKVEAEEALRALLERTLHTVEAAILKGRLG